jgi:hypothetical protein
MSSLSALRTYNCKRCTVTVNGSGEAERAARWSEGAPLLLDHGPKGGDPGWLLKLQANTVLPKPLAANGGIGDRDARRDRPRGRVCLVNLE